MSNTDRNTPLYMISVAAELSGLHPQTLRIYESKGLVRPQRTGGNTRMYSQADIERLELINELTQEGINLAGVIRIIDLNEQISELREQVSASTQDIIYFKDKVHELEMRSAIASLTKTQSAKYLPSPSKERASDFDESRQIIN